MSNFAQETTVSFTLDVFLFCFDWFLALIWSKQISNPKYDSENSYFKKREPRHLSLMLQ